MFGANRGPRPSADGLVSVDDLAFPTKMKSFWVIKYSPYAKVFVKRPVRHPCDTMLQYKFINYTTTTTRIVSKIKLQHR